jgi:iron complex transport system substrate-binding protein
MKQSILVIFIIILSIAFSGCNKKADSFVEQSPSTLTRASAYHLGDLADTVKVGDTTVTFIDALGNEVTTKKNPKKVMVLYNSYADLWYHSGGDMIGRLESEESMPGSFLDKPIVGNNTTINTEKIISMQPDLVILRAATNQAEMNLLKQSGIECLAIEYNSFEQYLYTLKIFTALTGREDLYKQNGTDLLEKINNVMDKVSNQPTPEVLLLLASSKTLSVRLPKTSTGQMLEHLGAKNIATDSRISEANQQIFSMEKIIEKNPDFIFVQPMGDAAKVEERLKADMESNPAWNSLDAVKNNRYIVLDKELYHFKANTRYAEAYEKLAKMLYPDLFK